MRRRKGTPMFRIGSSAATHHGEFAANPNQEFHTIVALTLFSTEVRLFDSQQEERGHACIPQVTRDPRNTVQIDHSRAAIKRTQTGGGGGGADKRTGGRGNVGGLIVRRHHGVGDGADAVDLARHHVARLEEQGRLPEAAHTGRSARQDDVTREQGHEPGEG